MTRGYIKELEVARGYARRGHSLGFTAMMMGIDRNKLRRIIEHDGEEIRFAGHRSAAKMRHLADLHESRRGRPQDEASLAALARGRQVQKANRSITAFGITGTIPELVVRFGCPVTSGSVHQRMARGMNIEEALTAPARRAVKGVFPPEFQDQINLQRSRTAARCLDHAQSRVMPTMRQFWESEYNIEVVAQDRAYFSVEVRSKAGTILHRLRFTRSYESVLYVFSPAMRGRLKFIAFEPNCDALQAGGQS